MNYHADCRCVTIHLEHTQIACLGQSAYDTSIMALWRLRTFYNGAMMWEDWAILPWNRHLLVGDILLRSLDAPDDVYRGGQ